MLIVQGLFSRILLLGLNLLFIVVVQGPSYGSLLCLTIQVPLGWILFRQIINNRKWLASKASFWERVTVGHVRYINILTWARGFRV